MPRISNAAIIHQIEQPILSVRSKINENELVNFITANFEKISDYIKELDEFITSIPLAIYHNYQNMILNEIDIEIAFPVTKILPEKDNIKSSLLPENKLVFSLYQGNPNDMKQFYKDLERWIELNSFEIIGPCYEYYYNGDEYGMNNLIIKTAIPIKEK
ncbi:MAG: GyrI-like domain-containing protein [Bacteroidales bacterium]|jgi:effector-binding domain-containing protein|nr:GyrI-like domain-containing protein [Bacteroidales bacterium]